MQITGSIAIQKETKSLGRHFLLPAILVLMFILTSAFFATVAASREPLLVKVGAYANPPKIFMNENGKVSGFWPDLIECIAKAENWKIEYVWGTWTEGLDRLETKKIDIMPDVAFTEERNKLYVFSEAPVLSSWSRVYVNKKNTEIQSITDLKNKKIAALKGSVNLEGPGGIREITQGFGLNCIFLELDSYTEVFKAIEENKADAGITNRNFGNKYARNFEIRMTPIIFQPINVKFAFPKDGEKTPFLVRKINERMRSLEQDGDSPYYQLLKKYFEAEIAKKTVTVFPGWLRTAIKTGGFLLLLFILVIVISRIEVRRKTKEMEIKNEMLRRSEQLLSSHLQSTPMGAVSWDLNFKVIKWNPAAESIFGYTKEEAMGRHATELLVPEDMKELVDGIFDDLLSGKGGTRSINENITKDGRRILCDWYNTVLKDVDGKVIAVASLVSDVTKEKQMVEALQRSEALLNVTQQLAKVGGWEWDVEKQLGFWTNEVYRIHGFDPSEITPIKTDVLQRSLECYDIKDRPVIMDAFRRCAEKGQPYDLELPFTTATGRRIWIRTNGKPILEGDKVVKIIGNIMDITEHKQTEDALRHSEERYRVLVEESFDGIFIQKGPKIIFANRRLHDMLGYDEGDLVGLDHWKVYHPEYQELTRKRALARMRGEETTTHYEVKMQRKDGSWFYAEIGARVVTIEGEPGIQVWIKDITERKQADEALEESESRLRNVFEASPLGIGLIQDREMQWHNGTMSRMLGYASEELSGKNARMLYESDEEFELVGEVISSLGPEKRTADIETRWVRKDGSIFDCHIRYALLNPESKDSVVLAMVEDITERKKAEKEREKLRAQFNQAQKMEAIGVLAGGVAHDFNNILTSIIGNAELALMDMDKNTSHYNRLEEIRKAGHRAAALTRQLLAFSRKELIRPEVLDLNRVAMNLEKMLRRLIGEDIELVTAYAPDLWQVEADPAQIEQIIMNLSVNARDAMPKGGKLTIETANVVLDEAYFQKHGLESEEGPYVMLAVTDNGTGIDKETQDRIFEPFFTTKEMGRGTGLGLSTVYGIVKQNKGHIWVYSEEGKGTTFKVYLPRANAKPKEKEEEKSPEHSLAGSETILIAEDDGALRKMAEMMLEGYGYKVITAENGKEAMKIAESHDAPIHLLVTDVVMPGMSGRALAEKLQEKVPKLKVLYMSGYTDNAIAHHGVLKKDVDFIQKPFTRERLTSKVREMLDRKQG